MASTITVAPLSTPGNISLAAKEAVCSAQKLFLQTAEHPSAFWITASGIAYESMDAFYSSCNDFDALNAAIAEKLVSCGTDAVYAAPGRGAGADFMRTLREKAKAEGIRIKLLPGSGYAEAALANADMPSFECIRIMAANALPTELDPYSALCVEEIDSRMRATEVKLALLEYYPDSYKVYFSHMDNTGEYHTVSIPVFELDRQSGYFASDVLIIPPASFDELSRHGLDGLLRVMQRLRAPGGCPWDAEQTHESLKKSLIEETYEVLDAIEQNDSDALCEELGDLLLQIVFHAQIEEELRNFTIRDVTTGITSKLVYRHPHVFGDVSVRNSDEVLVNWEQLKKKEKHQDTVTDAMRSVPQGFPALMRAQKLQKKAASVGFDWDSVDGALDKVLEESNELRDAINHGEGEVRIFEEAGDLLFSCVNAARLAHCDCELALRAASDKFLARFAAMEEEILSEGLDISTLGLAALDERWERVKRG